MDNGNEIVRIRKEMGMTQEEFGKFIFGASRRVIQSWEYGQRKPLPWVLELIKYRCETYLKNEKPEH